MKSYKVDQVEVSYRKDGSKYVADFYTTGDLLQKVPDPSVYWDLKFKRVKDLKKFADELSCGNLNPTV